MNRYRYAKKLVAGLLSLAMIIAMIPLQGQMTVQVDAAVTITVGAVNTGKVTIPAKSKYKLEAKASAGKLKYKSSKPKVVKVSKKGVIKGVRPGKAVISVKGKGTTKKITVKVVKKKKYKKVKKINIQDAPSEMTAGDTLPLKVAFSPAKASNKNLKFKSSDPSVARVNPKGVVEALTSGTATITVTSCANKKAEAAVAIEVLENSDHIVTFDSLGGTEVPPQTVLNGKKAEEPEQPTLENASFAGWFLDGDEEPFKFSTPIREDITLFARWNVDVKDVSADGQVDAGDLALLENAGKIQVMSDEDSSTPKAIIGQFTEEKIHDAGDAKDVLMSMESLFNKAVDEDGNLIEVDFNVKESDITSETVSTPADENGFKAPDEIFYKYSPTMPNGVGVEGGDIIIGTDTSGNVTGLNATYNPAINTLDSPSDPAGDWERIRMTSINYVVDQLGQDFINTFGYDAVNTLDCQPELIVSTGLEVNNSSPATTVSDTEERTITTDPFYVYKVRVTNAGSYDREPDYSDPDYDSTGAPSAPALSEEREENVDLPDTNEINSLPAIDWTVYVDAADYTTVYSAYNNISFEDWKDTRISLTRSTGDTRNTDLRYQPVSGKDKNRYAFYSKSRNLYVFPLCSWTIEDGKIVYGTVDSNRKSAMLVECKPSEISTWNRTANTLLTNTETVYDFYSNRLGWDSYNGKGANLNIGFYDDPANFSASGKNANAGWWGKSKKITFSRAVDGIDYSRCLDVVGHEFTHAVSDYKVSNTDGTGFKREGQSGSLDEAYSDIMGEIIQKNAGEGSKNVWTEGENRSTNGKTDNPSRSFSNPSNGYHDYYSGKNDKTSFYYDSTIFSHAFYLMVTDSRIKNEISWTTWGQLFFRSLSRLSADAKFLDARYAVLAEAAEIGLTGKQQLVIHDAFDSVGIKDPKKITVTLTWGSTPKDLDLYMVGPFGRSYYEVNHRIKINTESRYYNGKLKKRTILASLDQDCRSGKGPEVIKIHTLEKGNYYFLVRYDGAGNNMEATALAKSQAHVVVSYDNKNINYYVHSDSTGSCWLACMIKVDANGNPTFWHWTNYYSNGGSGLYRYGTSQLLQDVYKQY